ncbi:MAG: tetratricopeptide repeat protein [Alphaproteobacteria bacterium]|nr:tetratricopeptide repeat protein [Alphaproteobacteria bacterium]
MVDFIDEVNDDLRQERFNRFWQKVGAYVVAASVIIILATVASVLWQNHRETRQSEAAEAFLTASKTSRAQRYEEAAEQYAVVAEKNAQGFTALAKMREAYALTQAGEDEKALKVYENLMEDGGADKGIRALSRIYAAMLMDKTDKPDNEIVAMLKPLAKDNKNPFSAFAREQMAYAFLDGGDAARAHEILSELSADMDAPPSLRRRTQAQLATVTEAAEAQTKAQETASNEAATQ